MGIAERRQWRVAKLRAHDRVEVRIRRIKVDRFARFPPNIADQIVISLSVSLKVNYLGIVVVVTEGLVILLFLSVYDTIAEVALVTQWSPDNPNFPLYVEQAEIIELLTLEDARNGHTELLA